MRNKKKKKVWIKPSLTVIVRGTSAESILIICKIGIILGNDPQATYMNCMIATAQHPYCSGVCSGGTTIS